MPNDPIARRLRELGFVARRDRCEVVARGPIGAEPLLVQVGFTRFALRRSEAARVRAAQRGRTRMSAAAAPLRLALVGNPNCGKTALFNQLTGSRQKVANYAGVTVERKEGRLHSAIGRSYAVLDLPGRLQPATRRAWTKRSPATCAAASIPASRRRTCWSAWSTRPTCACTCASCWKCANSAGRWCWR